MQIETSVLSGRMLEYRVVVANVGEIGSVMESNEGFARCAALHKYGADDGDLRSGTMRGLIFEDDDFVVVPA